MSTITNKVKHVGKQIRAAIKAKKKKIRSDVARKAPVAHEYCFEITIADRDDAEAISNVVEQLQKHGYKAWMTVYREITHGYVLLKEKEIEKAKEDGKLSSCRVYELKKVDKHTAKKVKRYLK